MKITDSLTLDASGLTLTRDGYLVGDARVSRAGNVQQYIGSELGLTGDDAGKMFGVYRDPDVVFDEASMLSLAGRPVTRGHPKDLVTAENWKDLAKGQIGGVIRRDGEHVVAPMAIMDHAAVKEVEGGARALSAGYTVDVVAGDGTAPDGTPYQFRQAGALRFNHVAYLPDNNPRAGNTRIGDGAISWGASSVIPEKEMTMADAIQTKTVIVDGLSVITTDQGAQAIDKLQKQLADANTATAKAAADATAKLDDLSKTHTAALADKDKTLAAKDAELAKKDAEIDALKAKVVDAAALDKLVSARAELVATAKAITKDVKTDGLSDAAIRKAVVTSVLGDAAVKDKPDAYVDARFEILAEDAAKKAGGADAFRDTVRGGLSTHTTDADKARVEAEAAQANAWKPKAA